METQLQEKINQASIKSVTDADRNVLGPKPEWYKNPRNWLIAAMAVPILGCILSQIK